MSAALVVFSLGLWVALGPELRQLFTPPQIGTLVFFLAFGVAMMMSIGMSTITVDESGVRVRNAVFTRHHEWDEVLGARLGEGDPWAYIVLKPTPEHPEGRHHMALAIQRAEGTAAEEHVRQLNEAIQEHRAAV